MGIQAIGIHMALGGVRAFAGASLVLERKEIVGPIGPNCSGKTALLNVIFGRFCPEVGSVTLDGADISGMSHDKVARQVSAGTGSLLSASLTSR